MENSQEESEPCLPSLPPVRSMSDFRIGSEIISPRPQGDLMATMSGKALMQLSPPFLLRREQKERRKNLKKLKAMLSPKQGKVKRETHGELQQGPMHESNWNQRFGLPANSQGQKRRAFSPPLSSVDAPQARSASAFWVDYQSGGRGTLTLKSADGKRTYIDNDGWVVRESPPKERNLSSSPPLSRPEPGSPHAAKSTGSRHFHIPGQRILQLRGKGERELAEVRDQLSREIEELQRLKQIVKARCGRLKEVLQIFDGSIENSDAMVLKQRDMERLSRLLNALSDSLGDTTETEMELGAKRRALETCERLLGEAHSKAQKWEKRAKQNQEEIGRLQGLVRKHEGELAKQQKVQVSQQGRNEVLARRMEGLERGLLAVRREEYPHAQLKHLLNVVIREQQETKKELAKAKRDGEAKEQALGKLKTHNTHLKLKLDELLLLLRRKHALPQSLDQLLADQPQKQVQDTRSAGAGYTTSGVGGQDELLFGSPAERTLEWQDERLADGRVRGLVKDLQEYGSEAFLETTMSSSLLQQHLRVKALVELFVASRDFLARLNTVLNASERCAQLQSHVLSGAQGGPSASSQQQLRHCMEVVAAQLWKPLKADSVKLWICEAQSEELWSWAKDQEDRLPEHAELLAEAVRSGKVLFQLDSAQEEEPGSVFLYPVRREGEARVGGILEIRREFREELHFEQQYLAQVFVAQLGFQLAQLREKEQLSREFALKETLKPTLYKLHLQAKSEAQAVALAQRGVEQTFGVQEARLLLVKPFRQQQLFAGRPRKPNYYFERAGERVDGAVGIAHKVVEAGIPQVVRNPYAHALFNAKVDLASQLPINYFPLFDTLSRRGEALPIGVLQFQNPQAKREGADEVLFSIPESHKHTMQEMAATLAIVLGRLRGEPRSQL